MDVFEQAAASVVEALGETYVYFDGESTAEVQAVRSSGYVRVDGQRGPPVSSQRAELTVTKSEVPTPRQGHLLFRGALTAFVGNFDLEVVSVRPDDEDTSRTLICKAIRQ